MNFNKFLNYWKREEMEIIREIVISIIVSALVTASFSFIIQKNSIKT